MQCCIAYCDMCVYLRLWNCYLLNRSYSIVFNRFVPIWIGVLLTFLLVVVVAYSKAL